MGAWSFSRLVIAEVYIHQIRTAPTPSKSPKEKESVFNLLSLMCWGKCRIALKIISKSLLGKAIVISIFTYIAMFHVWICFTCLAMLPSSLYFSKNGNKWRVFIEWGSWGRTFLVRDVVYRFQCHKFIYLFISGAFLCSTSWIGIPPAHFTRPVYGKHSRTFPRDLITARRLIWYSCL